MSHEVDGSTFALLRLDGDLGVFNGSSERVVFPGGANVAAMLVASFTIEAWVYCTAYPSSGQSAIIGYGANGGVPDTSVTNYLASLRINTAGRLYFFWEHNTPSTGTNAVVEQPSGTAVPLNTWTHVAAVCSVSGGTRTVRLLINGVLVHSGSDVNAVGGTDSAVAWIVGAMDSTATAAYWTGRVLEVRISSVARADAAVLESYQRGPDIYARDLVAPVVAVVEPAEGTALASDDAIVIDVTDDDNALAVVVVAARMRDDDDNEISQELVHDGTAFAALYGTSQRSAITNGWRYTIRRLAGWRYRPQIRVISVDTGGNAAA